MNRIVLDASAILAVINGELGADTLTPALLAHAAASAVNLAEVQAKLVSRWLDLGTSLGRRHQPAPRSPVVRRRAG